MMVLIPARISFKERGVFYEIQKDSLLKAILWCREEERVVIDTHYDIPNGVWVLVCEGKEKGEPD